MSIVFAQAVYRSKYTNFSVIVVCMMQWFADPLKVRGDFSQGR